MAVEVPQQEKNSGGSTKGEKKSDILSAKERIGVFEQNFDLHIVIGPL